MAVPHQAQLRDQSFLNWVRAGLALKYTKEGIESFIDDETKVFHISLLSQLNQQPQTCGHCTTDILLPHQPSACPVGRTNCICSRGPRNQRRVCPNNVCGTLFDAIVSEHRFQGPSWKNSHISQWVSDHWEVAKTFLPNTGGYSNISSARDTDLSGLVNIGINLLNITVRHKLTVSSVCGPDDFCKCRSARNEILHCASQSLTDAELRNHLDVMKATLQFTAALKNDAAAQQAVTKLTQLETSAFEITDEDIKEVRKMALLAIKDEGSKQVEAVKNEGEKQIQNLQQVATTIADARNQEELNNLKSHLIETYLAQLQPDRLPEVDRLYVEPSMKLVTNDMRGNSKVCARQTVRNLKINDIFYQGQTQFSRIYISGDAGHGKTALCKMLVLAWCQEHSGQLVNKHIPEDFMTVMKRFEFLFYIPLRNIRKDWIISDIIKKQYFDGRDFPNMFIKKCDQSLVILDGLDEWVLPEDYETPLHTTHGLPDLRYVHKCSILTTTRPWKLEVLRLKVGEMDREVRLTGINGRASLRYISDMIDLLNQKKNVRKDDYVFIQQLYHKQLTHLRNIPILLKQLITLWHHDENEIIGSSQVHIYSAMINHLLKDAWERNKKESVENTQDSELPSCLKEKQYCKFHNNLLLSLARLAFTSACKGHLIVDHVESELQSLTKDGIKSCLTAGLLCQEIYASPEDDEKKKLSFLHKSFQDFLAAVFLVMNPESVAQISQSCNTLQKVQKMRSLFIFVSGMDSDIMRVLSQHIKDIMVNDEKVMQGNAIQDLMCECVRENKDSGQSVCPYLLEGICIDNRKQDKDWWQCLQHLIRTNITCIKSVYIGDVREDAPEDLLTCLNIVVECHSVQNLQLNLHERLPLDIEIMLDKALYRNWSLTSLCLTWSGCEKFCGYLYSDRVATLTRLDIFDVCIPSSEIYKGVMKVLGTATQLKTLKWGRAMTIRQMYGEEESTHQLDLSNCSQLQELTLQSCGVQKVTINTASLTICVVNGTPMHFVTPKHVGTPLQMLDLRFIRDPQRVLHELATILPHLTKLSHLKLTCSHVLFRKKCYPHLDLSHLSQLQELTLGDCVVTKVTVNTASLKCCNVIGTSFNFIQHRNAGKTIRNLCLEEIKDPLSLDELATILPYLIQLSDLTLKRLNFCTGKQCSIHLDLSHCSQLQKLTLQHCSVTKTTVNTATLTYCKINDTPVHFVQQPHVGNTLQTLFVEGIQEPSSLDEIVNILLHLTRLSYLELCELDFGDRDVCLSPEAVHLEKVVLRNVMMKKAALIQFLKSAPATCNNISLEFADERRKKRRLLPLDKIVDLLPHLTRVTHLTLKELNFGDRDVSLSPKATHIKTVSLENVLINKTALVKFLSSIPDTCNAVHMKFGKYCTLYRRHLPLDKIVDILPHLTRVTNLSLKKLRFGDRDVCLTHEASHLRTVTLDEVTMTDRAMIKFLDSVLTVGQSVFCKTTDNLSEAVMAHITSKFVMTRRYRTLSERSALQIYIKPAASLH